MSGGGPSSSPVLGTQSTFGSTSQALIVGSAPVCGDNAPRLTDPPAFGHGVWRAHSSPRGEHHGLGEYSRRSKSQPATPHSRIVFLRLRLSQHCDAFGRCCFVEPAVEACE